MRDKITETLCVLSIIALVVLWVVCEYAILADHQVITVKAKPPEVVPERLYEVNHDIPTITNTTIEDEIKREQHDIDVIAAVVQAEAGNQEMIGKVAVAITLLNRADANGRSVEMIAREAYAYPYQGVISAESYRAVEIAMNNRDLFPDDMMYFRTEHYHNFGVPYMQIQDHYFSTKE